MNFKTHKKLKMRVYARDEYKCQYCGKDVLADFKRWMEGKITRKRVDITVDHIVPLSKGGKWEALNLKTSCRACNMKKGDTVV